MRVAKLYKERVEEYFDKQFVLIGLKQTLDSQNILSAEVVRLMPGASTHYHDHLDREEGYYIMNGEGILTTDSGEQPARPGQAFYFPTGVKHCIRNTGTCALEYVAYGCDAT
ncbi:MAG: cupin domain-containing protein [Candidatus Latescibacteria bacterium]|nr:cupin domain-containing protein [Candidatus Latescibacterota bacterium]